jgi:hypothetical protein
MTTIRTQLTGFVAALLFALVGFASAETMTYIESQEVTVIDPALHTDESSLHAVLNIYDPLVYPKVQEGLMEPGPHVAESWNVSDDGRTYTFTIREGITFHSGNELDAHDVAFSMERLLAMQRGFSWLFSGVLDADGIEVIDDRTVEFELANAYAPFVPSLTQLFIVDREEVMANLEDGPYGDRGDYGEAYLRTNAAGSGPYMPVRYERATILELEAFDDYWRGWEDGQVTHVLYRVVQEEATLRTLLASGEATPDQIGIAAASTETYEDAVLALAEESNLPVHAARGIPALSGRDGQVVAALADVLIRGLDRVRVRRFVSLAKSPGSGALELVDLPDDWSRVLHRDAPLSNIERWERSLAPQDDDMDPVRETLRQLGKDLARGTDGAAEIGERWLRGRPRLLWRRALDEGGNTALEEERRLAYVGITRAREKAFISAAARRRMYHGWDDQIPSRFLDDLPDSHVERRGMPGMQTGPMQSGGPHRAGGMQDSYSSLGPETWTRGAAGQGSGPLIEGRAETISESAGQGYEEGERVFHQKFGYGTIESVEGNKLEIRFEKAGVKRVMDSFVEPA